MQPGLLILIRTIGLETLCHLLQPDAHRRGSQKSSLLLVLPKAAVFRVRECSPVGQLTAKRGTPLRDPPRRASSRNREEISALVAFGLLTSSQTSNSYDSTTGYERPESTRRVFTARILLFSFVATTNRQYIFMRFPNANLRPAHRPTCR